MKVSGSINENNNYWRKESTGQIEVPLHYLGDPASNSVHLSPLNNWVCNQMFPLVLQEPSLASKYETSFVFSQLRILPCEKIQIRLNKFCEDYWKGPLKMVENNEPSAVHVQHISLKSTCYRMNTLNSTPPLPRFHVSEVFQSHQSQCIHNSIFITFTPHTAHQTRQRWGYTSLPPTKPV